MKDSKKGDTWHASIKSIPIILLRSYTQNYQPTPLKKG